MSNFNENFGPRTFSTLHIPSSQVLLNSIPLPNLSHQHYLHPLSNQLNKDTKYNLEINHLNSRNYNLLHDTVFGAKANTALLNTWNEQNESFQIDIVTKLVEMLNDQHSNRICLNQLGITKILESNLDVSIESKSISPLMSQFLNISYNNSKYQNLKHILQSKEVRDSLETKEIQEQRKKIDSLAIRNQKFGKTPVAKRRYRFLTDQAKNQISKNPQEDKENIVQCTTTEHLQQNKRLGTVLNAISPQNNTILSSQQIKIDEFEIFLLDIINFFQFQKNNSQNESLLIDKQATQENSLIDQHTMDRLQIEVSALVEEDYLKLVEEKKIKDLLFFLLEVILDTSSILSFDKDILEEVENNDRKSILCLKAIHLSLEIMTYSYKTNNPSLFIIEEIVETIIDVLKKFVQNYLTPTVSIDNQKSNTCRKIIVRVSGILKLIDLLIKRVDLNDEFILRITNFTIGTYFVEGLSKIQLASLNIVISIFSNYPNHRTNCLQSIISSILSLSTKKNVERKFKIDQNIYVQTFTVLIVQLIQSCCGIPRNYNLDYFNSDQNEKLEENSLKNIEYLSEMYKLSQACANIFLKHFLEQCTSNTCSGDSRRIIENFVDDLLVMMTKTEFPSADILLQLTCKSLHKLYLESDSIQEKFRVCAIQILGKVACKCKEIYKRNSVDKIKLKENIKLTFDPISIRYETNFFKNLLFNSNRKTLVYCQLLQYIELSRSESSSILFARQYAISQWYSDDELKDKHKEYFYILFNNISNNFNEIEIKKDILLNIQNYILCKRKLGSINSIESILKHLLIFLKDDKAKLRSAAIKAIKDLIELDVSVIESTEIANAIIARQNDESILVRESILYLVGSVLKLSTNPIKIASMFFPMILRGLNDKGLSVRKRSIKILCSIYKLDLSSVLKIDIIVALARRLKYSEEESIHELILKSFLEMWFPNNNERNNQLKQNLNLISLAVGKENLLNFLDIDHYWLTKFLKSNKDLITNEISIRMIDSLFNIIIENNSGVNLSTQMAALYIVCYSSPSLFKNYVPTLIGFLNQEFITKYKDETMFFVYLFKTLEIIIPIMNTPNTTLKVDVLQSFQSVMFRTCTLIESAFELCINCLILFSSKFENNLSIIKIVTALLKNIDIVSIKSVRIIKILCLICRFFNFDEVNFDEFPELEIKNSNQILDLIYNQTLLMINSKDSLISSTAVLGLSALVIKKPIYFIDPKFSTALESHFKNGDPTIILSILELFEKYLESVEKNLISANNYQNDNSITTGIIPNYINYFFENLSHSNSIIREKSLQVVGIIIRQGLFIPQVCIPYVVALQADPYENVRNLSINICHTFQERHSNDLRSLIVKGMLLSYDLLISQFNEVRNYNPKTLFHRFYILICTYTRSQRNNILDSFLKNILQDEEKNIDKLCYFVNIIAHLNYGTMEEVIHMVSNLIHYIDQYSTEVVSTLNQLSKSKQKKNIQLSTCVSMYIVITLTSYLQSVYGIKNSLLERYEENRSSKLFDRPCAKYSTGITLQFEEFIKMLSNPTDETFSQFYDDFNNLFEDYMNSTIDEMIITRQIASSKRTLNHSNKDFETKEIYLSIGNDEIRTEDSDEKMYDNKDDQTVEKLEVKSNSKINKIGSTPIVSRKRKRAPSPKSPPKNLKSSPNSSFGSSSMKSDSPSSSPNSIHSKRKRSKINSKIEI